MLRDRVLVIDPGASRLSWGVFRRTAGGKLRVELLGHHYFDAVGARDETWLTRLKEAAQAADIGRWGRLAATMAIPSPLVFTKQVRTPAIAKTKRDRIVRFEAEQSFPGPLGELTWGHETVADAGGELHLLLGAARDGEMEQLCTAMESVGIRLARAVPVSLALRESLAAPAGPAKLLIEVGARSTHVILVDERGWGTRTLALGGETLTRRIAAARRLSESDAERIKIATGDAAGDGWADGPPQTEVERMAEEFGRQLAREVLRSVHGLVTQCALSLPAAVYLTGRAAQGRRLGQWIRAGLKLPVERFDPWRNVEVAPEALEAAAESGSHAAALVGLAIVALREESGEMDLLPRHRKAARALARRKPVWLAAAALAALALLPPIRHFDARAKAAGSERREIDERLTELRQMETRMSEQLDRLAKAEGRLAVLRRVVAARTAWESLLADLEDRTTRVGNVWLDRLSIRSGAAADPSGHGRLQLVVSGRLLDMDHPRARGSAEAVERMRRFVGIVAESPFVAAVTERRFDVAEPGLLGFEVALEVSAAAQL